MKKVFLFIVFTILGIAGAHGTPVHYFYSRFTSSSGLDCSYIYDCCQDVFGRMWVATDNGVFFYTGNKFVKFDDKEFNACCTGRTNSIAVDTESRLWMASASGAGYYDPYSGEFKAVPELLGKTVIEVSSDSEGDVWLVSSSGIWVNYFSGKTTARIHSSESAEIRFSCLLDRGGLAFSTDDGSIFIIDKASGSVKLVGEGSYERLADAGNSKILASTSSEEVRIIDLESGEARTILSTDTKSFMTDIMCMSVRNDEYWIGTRSGLIIYNRITGEVEDQVSGPLNHFLLNGLMVQSIFTDSEDNVWAGTFNAGLFCWKNYQGKFKRFVSYGSYGSLSGKSIRALCYDSEGNLWTGSEEGKLCRYDKTRGVFQDLSESVGIRRGTVVTGIVEYDGKIYVSVYGEGLFIIDVKTGRLERQLTQCGDRAMSVLCTKDGNIYVGTYSGLYLLDKQSGTLSFVSAVGKSGVHSMVEDERGDIWLSVYTIGLGKYSPEQSSFSLFTSANLYDVLRSNTVNHILPDGKNTLWVCTASAGLARLLLTDDGTPVSAEYYGKEQGFASDNTSSLIMSNDGHLWVGTSDGLVEFDPDSKKVLGVFLQKDHLIGSQFDLCSSAMSADGFITLGTREGFVSFDPSAMHSLFEPRPLIINNITAGTIDVRASMKEKGHSTISSDVVTTRQKDAPVLTISYSLMDYDSPNLVEYECILRHKKKENRVMTTTNHISYMALQPGKYEFSVIAHGTSDEVKESSRTIILKAPWYASTFAKILWGILFVASFAGTAIYLIRRRESEQKRRQQLADAENQKKSLKDKMDFMANVTHEIRTPVSLVTLLTSRILNKDAGQDSSEDLKSLKSNSERLMELCNKLLDFRKIQESDILSYKTDIDVRGLLKDVFDNFSSIAESRGIAMTLGVPEGQVTVVGDKSLLDSIISNLISNATKYCESKIACSLFVKDRMAVLRVSSDGTRIPEEESERIFEAFYQSSTVDSVGTGLGLAIARKCAEQLDGRLYLDKDEKILNSFMLELPVRMESVTSSLMGQAGVDEPDSVSSDSVEETKRTTVLIVEDNLDLRTIIQEELSKEYNTEVASNGEEAMEIVRKGGVDIVLSDIMMPVMNGCELCNAIKKDINYSHILVILLTAAVGVETQLRSLKSGVDIYIEKPFKMEVLTASIRNLIRNREIRNEQYNINPLAQYRGSSSSDVDMSFMDKLHEVIMLHLAETEMTTSDLAGELSISRQTLADKIKANTGMSTLEYVRVCRLKKAASLLAEKRYRVNEVAYLVGYSSPSYFTKHFQAQFGVKPSEFVKGQE